MSDFQSRRQFLRAAAAAGAAWAAADLLQVEEALAWAACQTGAVPSAAFVSLTADDAATLDALTSRIIPSDEGSPGAHEAGVIHFIDRSLSTFNRSHKPLYARGVRDLDRRTARTVKGTARFVSLDPTQQDQLIAGIEQTPFFQAVRLDTIVGTFALPTWGGNRDHAGWTIIGLNHLPAFQPPFGYYDAEASRKPGA